MAGVAAQTAYSAAMRDLLRVVEAPCSSARGRSGRPLADPPDMLKILRRLFAKREPLVIHGAISSVDPGARSITLTSGTEAKDVLSLEAGAKVMKGDQEMPLEALDVGVKLSAEASATGDGTLVAASVRLVEE